MLRDKYNSFDEWYKDYMLFKDNPNDRHLLEAIEGRTKNSNKNIKRQVKHHLQNEALETDPFRVFEAVQKELGPGYIIMINSYENPWFEA